MLLLIKKMAIPTLLTVTVGVPVINSFSKTKPKEAVVEEVAESVKKYTGFEVAMYYLKAHESFRPWEYPDGKYPSKGFGLNLTPSHVKWATGVLGFPARSRDWTYEEGQKVLRAFWQRKFDNFDGANLNEYQRTAVLIHAYNTGKTTNLRGCCGSKTGCGRAKSSRIYKAHSKRRDFEWRLYNGKVSQEEISELRDKAIAVEIEWKHKTK
jgi:hypothetical protein